MPYLGRVSLYRGYTLIAIQYILIVNVMVTPLYALYR